MSNDKWIVQCYTFSNSNDYMKAKKEQETVAYIRANTNLANIKVVAKLYTNLIEKDTFDTIIGYNFLEELRQLLLKEDILTEDSLPPIPIKIKEEKSLSESAANRQVDKYKRLFEKVNRQKKISLFANFLLIIVIVAMMILTLLTNNNDESKIETEILNKYSSWQQELQQKEDEIEQREELLNQLQDGE